jgi:predicted transposase/invertase (TIGR01784 family)
MRRDSIFYKLFQQRSTLLFELLPNPPEDADRYRFDSVEVKETSFRIDGVFLPPNRFGLLYFCEVQFQLDEYLYERLMAEIHLYARSRRDEFSDWRAVVIYPSRSVEQSRLEIVADSLASGKITRIYLDDLLKLKQELSMPLALAVLTIREGEAAIEAARQTIAQAPDDRAIIDLVSTIIVYKFSQFTRDEVDRMLGIELSQTRVYQDAKAEGKVEGKAEGKAEGETRMVMVQLNHRLGEIPMDFSTAISRLSVEKLEALGIALLNFNNLPDLGSWLARN